MDYVTSSTGLNGLQANRPLKELPKADSHSAMSIMFYSSIGSLTGHL